MPLVALLLASCCSKPDAPAAVNRRRTLNHRHEVAKHQTPYDDNSALEAGIAFGVAAAVVTSVLIVSPIASASPEGPILPGPGEGGGGAFR